LRDKKAVHLFLLVCGDDKQVNLKQLADQIGVKNLSLASAERLEQNLGITPGAVSILALVNDPAGKVQLLLDKDVYDAAAITAHPLINTATLVIQKQDLEKFLSLTNHIPRVVVL
jgi:Ala-tRNA(Pro) deacylase